jgi:hypothetical protein
MPPSAASTGRAALRALRSSPTTSSRLISSPTTKKNSAISPSLIQCRRSNASVHRPTSNASSVSQMAA